METVRTFENMSDEAIQKILLSAEQGYARAQYNVALLYLYGKRGFEKDTAKGIYWYHQAAQNGNNHAAYDLGVCYYYGQGVEQDYTKAFEFLNQAAKNGHIRAMQLVGDAYAFGHGVASDETKAFEAYLSAALRNN